MLHKETLNDDIENDYNHKKGFLWLCYRLQGYDKIGKKH